MSAPALYDAAFPADPVFDIALSHALLAQVAAGRHPPALRVFLPGPTVAFGRLDAHLPGFSRAAAAARERGFTPVLRSVGGHAAVFDRHCVVLERFTREDDATAGLQARFEAEARLLRDVLAALGADARIGELAGEYCPGAHSINAGGRVKLAGIAQRVVRHGAMTSAVVVVGSGPRLRELIGAVYGELGLAVDVATTGALDEELPGTTVERVAARLREANAAGAPRAPGAELLAAAHGLVARHRA